MKAEMPYYSYEAYSLLNNIPFSMIIHEKGRILHANERAERLLSGEDSKKPGVAGSLVSDFFKPAGNSCDMAIINCHDRPVFERGIITRSNGTICDAELVSVDIKYNNGTAILAIIQDITEFQNAERKYKENEWCYQSLAQSSLVGVFLYSENRIYYANSYLEELLGYTFDELASIKYFDLVHPDDREAFDEDQFGSFFESKSKQYRMLKKDGSVIYVESYSAVMECDGINAVLGTILDITHLKKAEEQIRYLAGHDQLTDLPNRRLFNEAAAKLLEKGGTTMGLLFMDLDRFKAINDTFGHSFGDEILKLASSRLVKCVDGNGEVYRHGGDEFIIVLGNADRGRCAQIAHDVVKAFNKPFKCKNYEVYTTASIGISMYPDDGDDLETLVVNADAAMYSAKIKGKCNYQFFSSALKKGMLKTLELENGLRRALAKKEFRLHYQPQFDLETGRLSGIEALARWRHPVLGMISPADFIPRAEDTGLIIPLGKWILETACKKNRQWQLSSNIYVPIAVNVSGCQLKYSNFTRTVKNALNKAGLEPQYLVIEITESVMQDIKRTQKVVSDLRAIGVKVAIDDFGKGYSSLNVLKSIPVDLLKIDQSFINDADSNPSTNVLVKFIIKMGHQLNSKIVAEGIENEHQAFFLKREKCNIGQGYYFSRPMPGNEIEKVLNAQIERKADERLNK